MNKPIKIILLLFSLLWITQGLKEKADPIANHFKQSQDTLCLNAYLFLQENAFRNEKLEMIEKKDFLIQDIELAVNSCRNALAEKKLSFPIFCNYVLPQRIFYEKPGNWRKFYRNYFAYLKGRPALEICDSINNKFKKRFQFGENAQPYQTIGWEALQSLSTGGCYLMAKSLIHPLRAMGIPTTIDFIHTWGNEKGAHCWNVIYLQGKMIPFMGRESNPGIYNPFLVHKDTLHPEQSTFRYPPKIFRKTYAINSELLQLRKEYPEAEISPLLKDIRVKDVTASYFPVSDIRLEKSYYLQKEPAYLAVYGNNWEIAAIGCLHSDSVFLFKNMKRNMLYIAARYENKKAQPLSYPFILREDGSIQQLKPTHKKTDRLTINFLYPLLSDHIHAWTHLDSLPKDFFGSSLFTKYRRRPVNGKIYTLYYRDKQDWQIAGKISASLHRLFFASIPTNALFMLADADGNFPGRCFTVEKGNIKWW